MHHVLSMGCILVLATTAFSGIKIRVSTDTDFESVAGDCANDTSQCCPTVGGTWYRYAGLKCMREGRSSGLTGCVAQINEVSGTKPFTSAVSGEVSPPYVVYGECQSFNVPVSGVYSFKIQADVHALVLIDGATLRSPWTPLVGNPLGVTGDLDPLSDKHAYTVATELNSGTHRLEFMYFSSNDLSQSRFILSWALPGQSEPTVIAPEAFGGTCAGTGVRPAWSNPDKPDMFRGKVTVRDNHIEVANAMSLPVVVRAFTPSGSIVGQPRILNARSQGRIASGTATGIHLVILSTTSGRNIGRRVVVKQ